MSDRLPIDEFEKLTTEEQMQHLTKEEKTTVAVVLRKITEELPAICEAASKEVMSEIEQEGLTSIFLKLAAMYLTSPAARADENKELSETVEQWIKFSAARLATRHSDAQED